MAWISVHDHVDGKKLRKLCKALNCDKAEGLGILNFLWFWGLNNANESGEIEDADREDIETALSGVTRLPIKEVIESLFYAGWLDDVAGRIFIHDWSDWQEQWYKFCKRRDYDAKRKRDDRARKRMGAEPEQTADQPQAPVPPKSGQENDPQPPLDPGEAGSADVPKKAGKKKRDTVKMAEFVHLTEREYQKLCTEFGKKAADLMIQELDLYKGSKGATYKDDYRAILSWVVDRVEKKFPGVIVKKQSTEGNPFKQFEGGDS